MAVFRHILFPVDLSEQAHAFRPYVRFVARQCGAKLTLLHVVPIPAAAYGDLGVVFPSVSDLTAVEERMRPALKEFFPPEDEAGIPEVRREVQLGDPAVVIADYTREQGVDLIMLPTHGYGRFRNFLLGSVASKVLHDAACPVWTAAHAEAPSLLAHLKLQTILAAVDLVHGPKEVILRADQLAQEFRASVQLVHAVPGAERRPGDTGGAEFGLFLLRSAREHIDQIQREAGTSYELIVEAGGVAETIARAAREKQADLIVLGRGVVHGAFGRLRSQTYEIIRLSPCPVLSL